MLQKKSEGEDPVEVGRLGPSDYFGKIISHSAFNFAFLLLLVFSKIKCSYISLSKR